MTYNVVVKWKHYCSLFLMKRKVLQYMYMSKVYFDYVTAWKLFGFK